LTDTDTDAEKYCWYRE